MKEIYLIKKGVVNIKKRVENQLITIIVLKEGAVFGEREILGNIKERMNMAICESLRTKVFIIPITNFNRMIDDHKTLK